MNQWKNFEKEQPQKTGIKYLVVTSIIENGKEKITGYEVCEFYKKGQKIEIAKFLAKKRASEDLSAADLIGYITCPVDGFYLRTNLVDGYFHDSLTGPKNEAEKVHRVYDQNVYWTDLPEPPNGLPQMYIQKAIEEEESTRRFNEFVTKRDNAYKNFLLLPDIAEIDKSLNISNDINRDVYIFCLYFIRYILDYFTYIYEFNDDSLNDIELQVYLNEYDYIVDDYDILQMASYRYVDFLHNFVIDFALDNTKSEEKAQKTILKIVERQMEFFNNTEHYLENYMRMGRLVLKYFQNGKKADLAFYDDIFIDLFILVSFITRI